MTLTASFIYATAEEASAVWKQVSDALPVSLNRWRLEPSEESGRRLTLLTDDSPQDLDIFERACRMLAEKGERFDAPDFVILALTRKRERVTAGNKGRKIRNPAGSVLYSDGTQGPLNRPQG